MIDMHAHCLPRITRDEAFAVDAERAPWLELEPGARAATSCSATAASAR